MTRTPLTFNERGEGWHFTPKRRVLLKAGALLVLALFLAAAARELGDGDLLAAAFMTLIGFAFGVIPFGRTTRRLSPRLYDGPSGRGLLLPTHPMKLTTLLSLGLLGALLLVGGIGIGVEALGDGRPGRAAGSLIGIGFGAVLAVGAYAGVRSRLAVDRGVLLTPEAVVLRTQREPITVAWSAVTGVRPHWTRFVREGITTPGESISNWLTFEAAAWDGVLGVAVLAGVNAPTVDAEALAVDPERVLAICRFYLAEPEAREELATEAALARLGA